MRDMELKTLGSTGVTRTLWVQTRGPCKALTGVLLAAGAMPG